MLGEPTISRVAKRREATRQEILDAAWAAVRETGPGALTLRDVAERVGMRPPSLYSHFDSKHAIYDAMFGQAWAYYLDLCRTALPTLPSGPRAALKMIARQFFDFSVQDLARYQLMNQRSIPDFHPSAESYTPAVETLGLLRRVLTGIGLTDDADIDLFTALTGGLVDQQLANDPGGTRWRRLLDRAIDMYATEMGLPADPKETR